MFMHIFSTVMLWGTGCSEHFSNISKGEVGGDVGGQTDV